MIKIYLLGLFSTAPAIFQSIQIALAGLAASVSIYRSRLYIRVIRSMSLHLLETRGEIDHYKINPRRNPKKSCFLLLFTGLYSPQLP